MTLVVLILAVVNSVCALCSFLIACIKFYEKLLGVHQILNLFTHGRVTIRSQSNDVDMTGYLVTVRRNSFIFFCFATLTYSYKKYHVCVIKLLMSCL